jgi:Porin subfamily
MKMVKSLILGSAAGLLAMSGAQAAYLPVKAKPVEYVKICSLYGAGFFYIPGTDTCLKLGGYLRVDTTFNGSIYDQPAWSGDLGQRNRYMDYFAARSRMALTVDTRTATEYGVVRTFMQGDFQFSTLGASTFNPNSLNTSLAQASIAAQYGGGVLANNANLLDTPGGGYVAVEFVFIQFAGFTFGKSASAYATPWHGYPGNNSSFLLGGHDTVTGVNNIQYTWQFGNGVSATLGLDDPTVFNRTNIFNLSAPTNTAATSFISATASANNAYGGVRAPDVVGNIRVDQAWGLFQVSGAAHEVTASYNSLGVSALPTSLAAGPAVGFPGGFLPFGASEPSGHPSDKWGGSVMVALQIKNIPWGAGDDIKMDASWAKGDTKNVISTSATSPNFLMFGGTGRGGNLFLGQPNTGAYQSVGFGATTDAVYMPRFFSTAGIGSAQGGLGNPGTNVNGRLLGINGIGDGSLHLTEAFGFRGAYNHNWDPYWSSSLFGSASAVRYDNTAKLYLCSAFVFASGTGGNAGPAANFNKSADFSCNPDFNVYQLGFVTRWTPVKNLTFSAEVQWFHLDQKFTGTSLLTTIPPKPNAVYEFKDQDTVALNVRVQRNF